MKTIIKLAAGTLLAASPLSAGFAQKAGSAVVVTVDTQRVGAECTACKTANAQIQAQITALQQRAQALGAPLETEANAIRAAIAATATKQPDAATQKRIAVLQQKQASAQQEMQGREQTVQRNRAYVSQQISTKLGPIFQSVMTARGANLMLDTQATLAAASGLDVTNDVLTQLNAQLPSVSTTAPAAPATAPGR